MKKYLTLFFGFLIGFFCHSQNMVSTYAGTTTPALIDGDTAAARFKTPFGICMDKLGNLYVADGGNNCIRKITPTGTVTTLAGTGVAGFLDGPAASAQFNSPTGVCVDDSLNVYVADFQNQRIRKISFSGTVTTIAGNGTAGYADGPAGSSMFNYPRGICRNKKGVIYVGDSWNHRVRKIVGNTVSTYAGGGSIMGVSSVSTLKDASDTAARFYTPCGLAIDKTGNIYVADAYNHRIRKIDTLKQVTTIAGSGSIGVGNGGYSNGPVSTASLSVPTEVGCDSTGTRIYIGDTFNNRVRLLSSGNLSLLAGSGVGGYVNGVDVSAQFNYPRGVVANANNTKVFVVDYNNHCIRKISAAGPLALEEPLPYSTNIQLYPNPNNGAFKITGGESCTVKIVDQTGKIILTKYLAKINEFALPELSNGIYTAIISNCNTNTTLRFIKN